ncbi:hypothetical protein MPTK1_1g21770 [Marchantia polymorpha subsp. ruderalis]|uniref:Patatin n=4 Tax=Marchantia polymorpha TaxID=3197 RepID=A0AAF6AST9_MARPO|nr:hypothetical protein MARPO_0001s0512 [Marchantia polymorpha]BBM99509.1 hypothetical protein Mp_1g21770 [Marchantia polymorpha subsp. ruderalis]|eukprot:PTQ50593.1 hypothetical protein MARPO_0001s0512 [Marchantia polymorpha]
MEQNDTSRDTEEVSGYSSVNGRLRSADDGRDAEALEETQEKHATYAGVPTPVESGDSPKIDLTTVGENVARRCKEDEEADVHMRSFQRPQRIDSVGTGENVATTTSASAPVHPPQEMEVLTPVEEGSSCLPFRSDSMDEILDSSRLLQDVKPKSLSPSSSSRRSEPATTSSRHDNINPEQISSLARLPSYTVNVPSDSNFPASLGDTTGFDPGGRRVTILSMDGGGMRGLIAARILAHLESLLKSKTGEEVKLCEYFDFLAGTSTGAILTTMINTPDENGQPLFTAQQCCQFYSRNGKNIFRPRWYDPFHGKMRQFYRPKYSAKRLERLLKSYLIRDGKVLTMRDTMRPFLVTSFDISQATPHIFVRQAAMKDESRNFRLWEVCRGTAAAPTYFKPAEISSTDGRFSGVLIDGGAIQNNPSLVAMTHVLGNNEEFPEASGLQNLLILSLGAGQLDQKHESKVARKWGLTGWVRPLLNIMMDGSSDTIDYQLAASFAGHSCSENYLRIQLSGLPNKTPFMDCTTKENIKDLINCADELLQQKAAMRNAYGEKVTLEVTYAERLSWFADQLIAQKKLREELGCKHRDGAKHPSDAAPGLGPTARLVSPMISHLFTHKQTFDNHLMDNFQKSKSLRY